MFIMTILFRRSLHTVGKCMFKKCCQAPLTVNASCNFLFHRDEYKLHIIDLEGRRCQFSGRRFSTKSKEIKRHISSTWCKQGSHLDGDEPTNKSSEDSDNETKRTESTDTHDVNNSRTKWIKLVCFACAGLTITLFIVYNLKSRADSDEEKDSDLEAKRVYDPELGKKAKMIYYKGAYLPYFMENELQKIEEFEVRDSDIWVITFPKSGTTWVQEMVYLIQNDIDIDKALSKNMEERFSYFEFPYPGLATIQKEKSPRFIKSHLPFHLLPKSMSTSKCKKIYVIRNPRDVAVSYYHFIRMISEIKYKGHFAAFFEKFRQGKVAYGPWWEHVKGYWEHKDDENILFIKYEELQKHPYEGVKKIAKFLDKDLTEKEVYNVAVFCSFFAMSNNPASNYAWWDTVGLRDKNEAKFMRKGIVGDWKNYFTMNMCHKMDKIVDENFEGTGLTFEYEIPKR